MIVAIVLFGGHEVKPSHGPEDIAFFDVQRVREFRRRSGQSGARDHRGLGKRGGRPEKLDRKGPAALKRLATGTTQAECAAILGASVRTIGRAVARMRPWHE